MLLFVITLLLSQQNDQLPFYPSDKFTYELDYSFKKRTAPSGDRLDAAGNPAKYDATPLPYVILNFTVSLDTDAFWKYRIESNRSAGSKTKKVKLASEKIELDMGFAEDIKDRITSNIYTIYFLNHNKEPTHRIEVSFDSEGNMLINNEKRGQI